MIPHAECLRCVDTSYICALSSSAEFGRAFWHWVQLALHSQGWFSSSKIPGRLGQHNRHWERNELCWLIPERNPEELVHIWDADVHVRILFSSTKVWLLAMKAEDVWGIAWVVTAPGAKIDMWLKKKKRYCSGEHQLSLKSHTHKK